MSFLSTLEFAGTPGMSLKIDRGDLSVVANAADRLVRPGAAISTGLGHTTASVLRAA